MKQPLPGPAAIAVALLLSLPAGTGRAEAAAWEQQLGFEMLLNEGYYSSNWSGDERTSGSLTATLDHLAARQFASPLRFEHGLALAFGRQVAHRDSAAGGGWETSESDDKVRLDEALRLTLGLWVDPMVSVQLKSQFTDGRDSTRTCWFNPLQLLEVAGAGRRFFADSTRTLTSELGAAARQLFDRSAPGTVADAGVSWTSALRTIVFSRNADYSTRLVVYKPLFALGGEAEIGTWPQVDWEHELSARFNKALSGKVYVQLLYDENVTDDVRLKQTVGMGLSLAWPAAE